MFVLVYHPNLVGLLYILRGSTPLDKRVLHRFFLDNLISIPGFCWHGWLENESHTWFLQQKVQLSFLSRVGSFNRKFPIFSIIFVIWADWKPLKSSADSFLLNSYFLISFLLYFTISSEEKSGGTFKTFLGNVLCLYDFISCKFWFSEVQHSSAKFCHFLTRITFPLFSNNTPSFLSDIPPEYV